MSAASAGEQYRRTSAGSVGRAVEVLDVHAHFASARERADDQAGAVREVEVQRRAGRVDLRPAVRAFAPAPRASGQRPSARPTSARAMHRPSRNISRSSSRR